MGHENLEDSQTNVSESQALGPQASESQTGEFQAVESDAIESSAVGYAPSTIPHQPKWEVPLLLFFATCASTYLVGGLAFAFALMSILLAHEFGHFLQARRYGVPASFPCFIPMPISPIGTMGAVIAMQPGKGDRRSLFDIAITGPIAGLIPAVLFSLYGLSQSAIGDPAGGISLGEPLFFKAMVYLFFGAIPEGKDVLLHPVAFAGWVGIFITALNLFPIGQLDGGHILYALLRSRSHRIAKMVMLFCIGCVVYFGYYGWSIMLILLLTMGVAHPKTADDEAELGMLRYFLGWLALLFMPFGFTPVPFMVD